MLCSKNLLELYTKPVYCFTTDIDWAPEWAIERLIYFFKSMDVPLTPFITHNSEVISKNYNTEKLKKFVGVHPNFLRGSSHGDDEDSVVRTVKTLWENPEFYRSHCFYDNYRLSCKMKNEGFKFDSNLGLFLEMNSTPLFHNSGMIRFPVFWEDDIHYKMGLEYNINNYKIFLDSPGIKIFNVHPMVYSLNIPTEEYYNENKFMFKYNHFDKKYFFKGNGTATFLYEIVNYIKTRQYNCKYLKDMYDDLSNYIGIGEKI